MRKAFYIVMDTTQSDVQCIREFEHAVGELTSVRPEVIKRVGIKYINPPEEEDEPKTNNKRLSRN